MSKLTVPMLRGVATSVLLVCPLMLLAGSRALETPHRYRAGTVVAAAIYTGDFDRDGKQDFLASGNGSLGFFHGNGNGTFADPVMTGAVGVAHGVADFDRDGKLDLCVARSGGSITIMRGIGDGTFAGAQLIADTPSVTRVATGDFNGDSFADIAGASESTASFVVYFGNGAGTFTPGPTTSFPSFPSGSSFRDLEAGDFDGDGTDDLILLAYDNSLLAWNNGSGSFSQQEVKPAAYVAVVGDVNGDGRTDLVTHSGSEYSLGGVNVYFGATTRIMPLAEQFNIGRVSGGLAIAQMNGSGGRDIVVGSRDLTVITHDGTNFLARAVAGEPSWVGAADFDGDGKGDVVTFDDSWYSFIKGNGDGTLPGDPTFHGLLDKSGHVPKVTDLNGDGQADLLIRNPTGFMVSYANGTGGFIAPIFTPYVADFAVVDTVAGHVNNDGRIDVVLYGYRLQDEAAHWQTFLLQANGTFVAGPSGTTNATVRVKAVGDLTNDGYADILDSAGTLFVATGTGTFGGGYSTGMAVGQIAKIADVDHDGRNDVVTDHAIGWSGIVRVASYINNANGTFTARETAELNVVPSSLVDLTGDGFPELFGSSGIHRGNGDGTFQPYSFWLPTLNVYLKNVPFAADFDSDGQTDLAVPGAIFYGTGDTKFDGGVPTAAIAEVISTADFDGNGSPDVWLADPIAQRIVIVRTGRIADGTATAALTLDLGANPSRYASWVYPKVGVAVNEKIIARGAVVYKRDSVITSIHLPDPTGRIESNILPMPVGTWNVTVAFSGDRHYKSSSASKSHTVAKAVPWLHLDATPATVEKGQSSRVCTSAEPVDYGAAPTGTITVRRNGAIITDSAAPNGWCESLADLPVGSHTLTSEYTGDENYEARTATKTLIVTRFIAPMIVTIPAAPLYEGVQISVTASFPEDPGITGSVTFTRNGLTATVPISNGKAVWTRSFPHGDAAVVAAYSGSVDYEPALSSAQLFVYGTTMSGAPLVTHQTFLRGNYWEVRIDIAPVYGAAHYFVYRSINGAPFALALGTSQDASPHVWDRYHPSNRSIAYLVAAVDQANNSSPMSARVATTTFIFSDGVLTPGQTTVKALHVTQLQTAINGYRTAAGLSPITFPVVAEGSPISASGISALRTALAQARSAIGRPMTFTDPTLTPAVTRVRALHLQELRDGVR